MLIRIAHMLTSTNHISLSFFFTFSWLTLDLRLFLRQDDFNNIFYVASDLKYRRPDFLRLSRLMFKAYGGVSAAIDKAAVIIHWFSWKTQKVVRSLGIQLYLEKFHKDAKV